MLLLPLQYFLNVFFSQMRDLIALLSHEGTLSSQTIVSSGIKLLRIFIIVKLKIETFSTTLVLRKAMPQLKSEIARLTSSVFTCL